MKTNREATTKPKNDNRKKENKFENEVYSFKKDTPIIDVLDQITQKGIGAVLVMENSDPNPKVFLSAINNKLGKIGNHNRQD